MSEDRLPRGASGFSIERRGDGWVVAYANGGCRPATGVELALWRELRDPLFDRNRSSEDLAHAVRTMVADPLNAATVARAREILSELGERIRADGVAVL